MAEETQKKTLRDLVRAVYRRRPLFVTSAALVAFAVLIGACWWPLKYTAIARFERKADPASQDLVGGKSESFDTIKMTLLQELIGNKAIEAAVDELEKTRLLPAEVLTTLARGRGPDGKLTSEGIRLHQDLVRNLADDLKVVFEVRSPEVDLVSVSFTDQDPRLAQQLPNTLITHYINRVGEQIITNLTASRDFLKTKVDEADTRFAELTRKRIDFEIKNAGMLPDNPGALQQEIQKVSSDLDTIRRQQALAKQRLETFKAILGGATPPPGEGASAAPKDKPEDKPEGKEAPAAEIAEKSALASAMAAEQEYRDASLELARLQDQQQQYQRAREEGKTLSHMTDKHPKVVALSKQIEDLDNRIAKAKARMPDLENRVRESRKGAVVGPTLAVTESKPDPTRQRGMELQQANLAIQETMMQSEYQSASNELQRLEARLVKLQDSMSNYGPVRHEYLALIKEVADQQAEVDRWQRRLTEVQMALAAEAAKHRTHLSQVELAQEQFRPSSPKLLYVLALAILGGLAFGGGLVFLANMLDRSITTAEEAADHFGLPVLGTIGEITTASQQRRRKVLRWGLGPVAALVAVAAIGLATLNITLWLESREDYVKWKSSPVGYVADEAVRIEESIRSKLLS
jgi:uncharacterized protein involved in exopolysaccharide biosynthesis